MSGPTAMQSSDAAETEWRRILAPPAANLTFDTTGSSWKDPSSWIPTGNEPLGPGSIVKGRFLLEEQIGRGGMGIVFRVRDLRKVEAQDRNPYVAIKVLNEEFKRNPLALYALQREARKAQRIAHPNIVTVYDFDRDGTNVYLVMELLEGDPLDRAVKRASGTGMCAKEALRIARDLCRAMAHAHEQGILHADFKPSNVFLTGQGAVKVLDFGIARAVKRGDEAQGPVTVFDPQTLGALTPAYASCEVLEGNEPDVRDDIYSLACVVYEVLTGEHPFKRMPATQARQANLVPARPGQLSRRQWQVLQRALAFRRHRRLDSAAQLLQALLPRRRSPSLYVAVTAVSVTLLAATLFFMHVTMFRDRNISSALASADAAQVEPLLSRLRELAPVRRAAILLDDAARAGLIRYFGTRIEEAAVRGNDRDDYRQAEALLAQLQSLLPDSQAVKAIEDGLSARKNDASRRQDAAPVRVREQDGSASDPQPEALAAARSTPLHIAQKPADGELHDSLVPGQAITESQAATAGQQGDAPVANVEHDAGASLASESNDAATETAPQEETLAQGPDSVMQIASLEQMLLAQGQANDVSAALVTLRELRARLPATDPFAAHEAPQAIAAAELRMASIAAREGRFMDALSLADFARQMAPWLPRIDAARDRYASYYEIDYQLKHSDRIGVLHLRWKLSRLAKQEPEEMVAVTQSLARNLAARILSTRDPELGAHLAGAARKIFAGNFAS
jgi:hypothetical protein